MLASGMAKLLFLAAAALILAGCHGLHGTGNLDFDFLPTGDGGLNPALLPPIHWGK